MRAKVNSLAGMWVGPLLLFAGLATAASPDLRLVNAVARQDADAARALLDEGATSTGRERMASRRSSGQHTGMIWERPGCY